MEINISVKVFNDIYIKTLNMDNRYMIYYGGAGSGKSFFVVQRYLYKMLNQSMCNLLVVRNVDATNRDSTFALFKQVINLWNLSDHFKVNEAEMRVRCLLNDNEVIFKGLDNPEKLKSITFSRGELTDVWVEEASEISEAAFNQLDIRLRGKGIKKQFTLSFNPIDINHWLKTRFFDNKNEKAYIMHTTYKDNKFLDDDYKDLLESYKETDRYYYDVYCMGNWGVLGQTIFDAQKVSDRLIEIRENKVKRGYFTYKKKNGSIIDISFVEDNNGYIEIYEDVKESFPYCIGGDTSGEGSDYFVADVIDNTTGVQVAQLRQQFDEDLYAEQVYCLAMHYNEALVGIETNFSTYPVKRLELLGYTTQYQRESEDTFTGKLKKSYGFVTNKKTRPLLIADLVELVRESVHKINSKYTLDEMLTFVRSEKGKPEAQQGKHDDCIMCLGITHYISDQQLNYVDKVIEKDYDIDEDDDDYEGGGNWIV